MSFSSPPERMNDANERDAAITTALYAALGSLDVQLEAELERYRTVRDRQDRRNATTLDRPAIIPEATIADAPIPITAATELTLRPEDQAVLSEISSISDSPFDLNSDSQEDDRRGLELGGDASDLELTSKNSETRRLSMAADAEASGSAAALPEGYLASSEALLASNRGRRRPARKVSPLGVGGVLLLLLASATVGYILVNPESLDRLGWGSWFARKTSPTDAPNSTANNPDSAPVADATNSADLPTSPNLAAEEFVDIKIDTLSELAPPSTPTPAPTPTPTPSTAPNSIDNLANALAPQTNPSGTATPGTNTPGTKPGTTPASTPAPTNAMPPLPAVTADPNYRGFYLVVVNESNATALARIQSSYPEAYFEQIVGARRIQVGAFDNLAIAQEVVSRLTGQGLPAQVYRP